MDILRQRHTVPVALTLVSGVSVMISLGVNPFWIAAWIGFSITLYLISILLFNRAPNFHGYEYIPDPIIVLDSKLRIYYCNPACCHILQCAEKKLYKKNVSELATRSYTGAINHITNLVINSSKPLTMLRWLEFKVGDSGTVHCEVAFGKISTFSKPYVVLSLRSIESVIRHNKALKNMEKRHRETFENCAVGLAHVGLDGMFLKVNHHLLSFLGYSSPELYHLTFQDITHPDDLENDLSRLDKLINGEIKNYSLEKRYKHKEGHYVWGRLTVALVRDIQDQPEYFISVIEDIEHQKLTDSLLYQAELKFQTIVSQLAQEMVIWISTPGVKEMLFVNEGYENIWRRSSSSLYENPRSFIELIHPDDKDRVISHLKSHAEGEWNIDYRIKREDGSIRYIHDIGFGIKDEEGRLRYLVGTAYDRTREQVALSKLEKSNAELVAAQEKLMSLATTDPLTNCINRRQIKKSADMEINRFKRTSQPTTLVVVDLDKFKYVNDTFGHSVGDQALIKFTDKVRQLLRKEDVIGRFGGDEFVIILPNTTEKEAEQFIQRLKNESILIDANESYQFTLDYSCGIAELDFQIDTFEQWFNIADEQLYSNKQRSHSIN
jgi:diguanylate cyclase (GGDEF)-like protein/PAS domain S-box-containing protein